MPANKPASRPDEGWENISHEKPDPLNEDHKNTVGEWQNLEDILEEDENRETIDRVFGEGRFLEMGTDIDVDAMTTNPQEIENFESLKETETMPPTVLEARFTFRGEFFILRMDKEQNAYRVYRDNMNTIL